MPLSQFARLTLLALLLFAFTSCQRKRDIQYLPGIWHGIVYLQNNDEVAIKMEFQVEGENVIGTFINGDERLTSTSGSFDGLNLKLKFDYFDAVFEGGIARREVIGTITRTWKQQKLVRNFKIWRGGGKMIVPAATGGKDLSGEWEMKVGEGEKQRQWRLMLTQKDGALTGTILTPSGDWGTMTGEFAYDKMLLTRFDVINARLFRAQLNAQGQLEGMVDLGQGDAPRKVIAERVSATAPVATQNTKVKNPTEPFKFSGIDLTGKTIDSTDPRFKNKVIVIEISGTWCPNCYDEAPLLKDLYARYQSQGLEVVGLSFEYTGDTKRDLEQVKIFNQKHDIPYLMLLAGSTENDDIAKKLPQLENFGAYPTTIFIGRDGLVKKIHAGFDGPATGERHTRLKVEFEETVKELLKEGE
ncbi:MAG TPA: TlpA disulfide reductase family protein [Blastocatellia bacterium]|nr:TlpA disulfide reductase family protein [Blastocatellia bacterium]